jgi:hypothetical protein
MAYCSAPVWATVAASRSRRRCPSFRLVPLALAGTPGLARCCALRLDGRIWIVRRLMPRSRRCGAARLVGALRACMHACAATIDLPLASGPPLLLRARDTRAAGRPADPANLSRLFFTPRRQFAWNAKKVARVSHLHTGVLPPFHIVHFIYRYI